jgi:tetratricopeptide (TPR) repeat protein
MTSTWEQFKERGNDEFKKKNYLTAINYYTQAIDINPNQDVLYSNRALCYLAMSRTKQALYDLKNCIELNPASMKALRKLAMIQTEYGNLGDAEILLQRCMNLDSKDGSIRDEMLNLKDLRTKYELADELYQNKSDYQKLEQIAGEVANKCKLNQNIKRIYIESLIINMKYNEALKYISSNITDEEKSSTDEYEYLLALTYYHDGKYDNAKRVVRSLLGKNNNDERYKKLSHILNVIEKEKDEANEIFKKGDYDKAYEAYSKLLELDPENKPFCSLILANRALCN